ncbi:uncharacterized protein LOC110716661 [Chenopodium quinoa]|uniref:Uncharacterized protein n=1 Tax=Chenopodium quinoa TaxID=63459 RepID=A0A803MYH3_CHEQI|nr:uncharacterized protein LOC110716661 [Chenopodium quinoa]
MSPKTTTISLTLLALTLTLTLSSAQAKCPASSIPKILNLYDLPPSIFPSNVQSFSCDLITENSIKLSINLTGECVVTRELWGVKNVLTCKQQISATLSYRKLADVKGVTVDLSGNIPPPIPTGLMIITGGKVYDVLGFKLFQFYSDRGDSPPFPFIAFPNEAPNCDTNPSFVLSSRLLPFNPLLVA